MAAHTRVPVLMRGGGGGGGRSPLWPVAVAVAFNGPGGGWKPLPTAPAAHNSAFAARTSLQYVRSSLRTSATTPDNSAPTCSGLGAGSLFRPRRRQVLQFDSPGFHRDHRAASGIGGRQQGKKNPIPASAGIISWVIRFCSRLGMGAAERCTAFRRRLSLTSARSFSQAARRCCFDHLGTSLFCCFALFGIL